MGERMPDYGAGFYRQHARRYAEVSRLGLQSRYLESTHPRLRGDQDLIERLKELVPPPARGLDAGCGAEARDVAHLHACGYEVEGLDAVPEVLETARRAHPEVADRLHLRDLREGLDLPDACLDFLLCNAVIQHIEPEAVFGTVLPEFARALKPGGVLLLMFKEGKGVLRVYDRDYGVERAFLLYEPEEVDRRLQELGLHLIPPEGEALGGLMRFLDPKGVWHAVGFWRKARGV